MLYAREGYRKELAERIRYLVEHCDPPHLSILTEDNQKDAVISVVRKYGGVYGVADYSSIFILETKDAGIADLIEKNSLKGVRSIGIDESPLELCYQYFV